MIKQNVLFIVFFLYSVVNIDYCFGSDADDFSYFIIHTDIQDMQYMQVAVEPPTIRRWGPQQLMIKMTSPIPIDCKNSNPFGPKCRYVDMKMRNDIIMSIIENPVAKKRLIVGYNMRSKRFGSGVVVIHDHRGIPKWECVMGNVASIFKNIIGPGAIVVISIALWKYRKTIKQTVFNALHIEYDEEGEKQEAIEHEQDMLENSSIIL